jgi:hypothetical protein
MVEEKEDVHGLKKVQGPRFKVQGKIKALDP